jgi:hypothetical protein
MSFLTQMVLISAAMALATIGLAAWLGRRWGVTVLGVALAAIAGVYVGFALIDGRGGQSALQVPVMFAFIAIAAIGIGRAPLLVAWGYILHALWDGAHHLGWITTHALDWYPAACFVYDAMVGLFLLWWLARPAQATAPVAAQD